MIALAGDKTSLKRQGLSSSLVNAYIPTWLNPTREFNYYYYLVFLSTGSPSEMKFVQEEAEWS